MNIFKTVITIGKNATVGTASLVTEDIPDNVVVAGVRAKVMRKLTEEINS